MSSQHIVIIGGSSGIGLATARHFLASEFRVTITGRNEARLAEAARELGRGVQVVVMDATDAAAIPAQFQQIGRFDHLVLALGSSKGVGPFPTISLDDVRQGFEEKVYAHFASAQAALPFLRPTGSITFVSGVAGLAAWPGTAGIGASNAAVAALVPILAVELKPLRVNGIYPGVIDTPWWAAVPEDHKQALFAEYSAKTPLGRVGQPNDVARAIALLIGSEFVTGQMLVCDGGLHLST